MKTHRGLRRQFIRPPLPTGDHDRYGEISGRFELDHRWISRLSVRGIAEFILVLVVEAIGLLLVSSQYGSVFLVTGVAAVVPLTVLLFVIARVQWKRSGVIGYQKGLLIQLKPFLRPWMVAFESGYSEITMEITPISLRIHSADSSIRIPYLHFGRRKEMLHFLGTEVPHIERELRITAATDEAHVTCINGLYTDQDVLDRRRRLLTIVAVVVASIGTIAAYAFLPFPMSFFVWIAITILTVVPLAIFYPRGDTDLGLRWEKAINQGTTSLVLARLNVVLNHVRLLSLGEDAVLSDVAIYDWRTFSFDIPSERSIRVDLRRVSRKETLAGFEDTESMNEFTRLFLGLRGGETE